MANDKTQPNGHFGFCGLLTLIFITLKLCKVIAWSWVWVLSPIWIPLALVFFVLILAMLALLVKEVLRARRQVRKPRGDGTFDARAAARL